MDNLIRKVLDCEVKKIDDNVYEFVASTPELDRDGEMIDMAGWDLRNFKKNPVIMYGHDYHGLPIGKASRVWISKDGILKDHVEFPPEGTYEFADIVHRLVDTGFLKAQSVGFIPKEWEDGDGNKSPNRSYKKQELLEISIVPIPSNPNAIREAVDAGVITTKQFEIISKPEETDDYIRIPVRGEAGKHEGHRIRTITVSEKDGIKALYCGECKVIITYLFAKDHDWTMERAQAWVREHSKEISIADIKAGKKIFGLTAEELQNAEIIEVVCPECGCERLEATKDGFICCECGHSFAAGDATKIPVTSEDKHFTEKNASQEEILDELDYLIRLIDTEGMNDEVKKDMWNLVREVLRITGSDIPDDIKSLILKEKKVEVVKPELTEERIAQIVGKAITDTIAKAQGKV